MCVMKKVVIITIVCFLLICIGYVYLCMKPIIYFDKPHAEYEFVSDSVYNPVDSFDFTSGKNLIILYINFEEIPYLPKNMKKWTLLKCDDNKIIECVKNKFKFKKYSEYYVGTTAPNCRVFFIKNNVIIFESDIIIERCSVALYFENTGWTFSANHSELLKLFSSFSPVYIPVIFKW